MGTGMARSAWTSARGGARSLAGFLQVPKSETHRALVTREFVFRNKRWSQAISWTSLEFGIESSKAHCPWHGRAPRPPRLLLRGPLLRRHVFGSTPQCGGTGSKGTRSDADRWSPMPHPQPRTERPPTPGRRGSLNSLPLPRQGLSHRRLLGPALLLALLGSLPRGLCPRTPRPVRPGRLRTVLQWRRPGSPAQTWRPRHYPSPSPRTQPKTRV